MPENAPVPRPANVIADLTTLISKREKRVDEEKKDKQQKNIKKAVEKMQAAFSKPVNKAIKNLMGKMGVWSKLWGSETAYPDAICARPDSGH